VRYLFTGNRCRSCPRDGQNDSKHCWCKCREFGEFHYCEWQWRKERLNILMIFRLDCSILAILTRTIMRRTVSGFARFSLVTVGLMTTRQPREDLNQSVVRIEQHLNASQLLWRVPQLGRSTLMTETSPFRVGPCQGDQSWNSVSVYTKIYRKTNAFIPMQRSNKLFQQTFEI
jgi:hypothetical protein